jgi:hypothetical protein
MSVKGMIEEHKAIVRRAAVCHRAGHRRPWFARFALTARPPGSALLRAVVAVAALAVAAPAASMASERAGSSPWVGAADQTTSQYMIRFYPRYLTYAQQTLTSHTQGANQLIGPATMGPQYNAVVAINDDTLYASAFVDLSHGPMVLTIPSTPVTYSLLTLDVFGSFFQTSITPQMPGTYALVLAGWQGTLPAGLTQVTVPYPTTLWIFRADKYSSTGQNMIEQANAFRASLHLTSLANYETDPASGAAHILPIVPRFALSFKVAADGAIQADPKTFLRTLQRAMHSPTTAPLSASDLQLSQAFARTFQAAAQAEQRGEHAPMLRIAAAARRAWGMIVSHWLTHVGATNWVHFDNIANWGTAYLDRAAANEYIQYGNNASAAGYWQAFRDGKNHLLNGAAHAYRLRFAPNQIPQAKRFWSLTAYVPSTVELVPNSAHKYVVARYTPGLRKNPDGSITIYMQPTPPTNAPIANWLPVPKGPFSVILRAYGPVGNTASPTYVPPPITS